MEGIHGVDTSWLHHSRGQRAPPAPHQQIPPTISDRPLTPPPEKDQHRPDSPKSDKSLQNGVNGMHDPIEHTNGNAQQPEHHHNHHISHPHLPGRKSSEKTGAEVAPSQGKGAKEGSKTPPQSPGLARKSSWMSSLTSKFSGNSPQATQNGAGTPNKGQQQTQAQNVSPSASSKNEAAALSQSPKSAGSGFLSNALRRFSSSTGSTQPSKTVPTGGICPRRVMNVDQHRERCRIPDMQPAKLRRVAFCVDVEIAAAPKYKEEEPEDPIMAAAPPPNTRRRSGSASDGEKKKKVKNKERSEGEALKNPNAMAQKKEKSRNLQGDMFEVPDDDPVPADVAKPAKSESKAPTDTSKKALPSAPREKSPETKSPGSKNPFLKSPMAHRDFGPGGMFEVDEWDEIPVKKPKVQERRGSTGGAAHHDFGRHGMFEIPSSSEDEGPKPKRMHPRSHSTSEVVHTPKSIVSKIGRVPVGHVFSEELMFEVPDLELQDPRSQIRAAAEAQQSSQQGTTPAASGDVPQLDKSDEPDQSAEPLTANTPTEDDAPPPKEMTRKKEKKKRSEEERKERKEKKRQAAIANGTIPVEVTENDSSVQPSNKPKPQSRPTTDPLRIYKRCCQLRETTPMPKIVDQLSAPNACDPLNPAVVLSLDLSGEAIQLQDVVTLGDWLAVVPVQKLMLENCGLTDEGVRMILAGLLAAKTNDQAKHNRHLAKKPNKDKKERLGVISKLSLKNNKNIGKHGWLHIGLFLNMSKSLIAIDLSMIPFPRLPPTPKKVSSVGEYSNGSRASSMESIPADPMDIFWKCMAERVSENPLEEVVIGECNLSAEHVEKLVDAVIACKVSRLGVAHNDLDTRGYHAIARYFNSKACMGLDLGGNRFSSTDDLQIILNAMDSPTNEMYAISLADCDLTVSDTKFLLPVLARLPNFKFVDLSHNHKLFEASPNVLSTFSRWLPRMKMLKRLGLNDVAMQSEHAIALAEIFPEMPSVAHISLLENPALTDLANAKDETSQEEACALYASLMAATRVSKTIVCMDIDVPGKENSEVVKALAKQVVAYSLRNMERNEHYKAAAAVIADPHGGEDAVTVPDVLLHLVGHVDNMDDSDDDTPAPDQDYLVGGTGVVKALSVVLGQKGRDSRRISRDITPVASGTSSPRLRPDAGKARVMSKNLLESARKIRHRLQPALVRAKGDAPEEENTKRLGYLDATLARMIERFESEYPECKQLQARPRSDTATSTGLAAASFTNPFDATHEAIHSEADMVGDESLGSLTRASRHGSDVSLASRQLVNEEGRLHRFGQRVRRELIPPTWSVDHHWGTTGTGEEPEHVTQLREHLESKSSAQIKADIDAKGPEQVFNEYRITANTLKQLEKDDPATWKKCKDAGMVNDDGKVADAVHSGSENGDTVQGSPDGINVHVRDGLTKAA